MRWCFVLLVSAACGEAIDVRTTDAGNQNDAGTQQQRDAGSSNDAGTTASGFCAPCVTSAECGQGSLCLGGTEARCGLDCSATSMCSGGATCVSIGLGKGPRLGSNCLASDSPTCRAFVRKAGLDCTTDTWANYGQNFFATTCIGACHRHDLAWTNQADVRASADSIRLAVENGFMPTDQTLSAAEKSRLLTWLACGAN